MIENTQYQNLSSKVDDLIELCTQLKQDNHVLRASEQSLREERAQLIEKNELARSKVEAMIVRLKALDKES